MSAESTLAVLRDTEPALSERVSAHFPGEDWWTERVLEGAGLGTVKADRGSSRLWAAIVLAPRVEVAEALLRGVPVPLDRLDRALVGRLAWA